MVETIIENIEIFGFVSYDFCFINKVFGIVVVCGSTISV